MKSTSKRLLIVLTGYIALFELYSQLSVSWRESTGEAVELVLLFGLVAALCWVTRPAIEPLRSRSPRIVSGSVAVILLFIGIYAATYFYSWHVRPNIGLYTEPEWIAEHPEFKKKHRARIEANMW